MKRLKLIKAATDFAFENFGMTDKVVFAESALAAFKAGGFDSADFDVWVNSVTTEARTWNQISQQKLPSEMIASAPAAMPSASGSATPAAS